MTTLWVAANAVGKRNAKGKEQKLHGVKKTQLEVRLTTS